MNDSQFAAVDSYVSTLFAPHDKGLDNATSSIRKEGMPEISVSPAQGKFLHLMARLCRAQRILEIGTLGGYSTIWLARALPPTGTLVSLELEEKHARVARANLEHAGESDKVVIRTGAAVDTLADLLAEHAGPFDMIFIDADKPNYTEYLAGSLKLSRPGTLIVADNVVREGEVANENSTDEMVVGVRKFNEALAAISGVTSGVLQTVGAKGYDGMAFAVVEQSEIV